MDSFVLRQWIRQPELLDNNTLDELKRLLASYPYFQTLRLLYLENLYRLHDSSFGEELRKSVLRVADCRPLFYLIEGDRFRHAFTEKESSDVLGIDRTLALINAFLAKTPQEQQSKQMELDYTMDYMAYLQHEDMVASEENVDVPQMKGQDLIDGFIRKTESGVLPPLSPSSQEENMQEAPHLFTATDDLDNSYFTETLAKIYMKQQRYEKALEIFKKLSLDYPQKSAYFADQIRLLEQMITNAKSK